MNKSQVTEDLFILFINFIVIDKQRPFKSDCVMKSVLLYLIDGITQQFKDEFDSNTFELKKTHLYFHFSLVFCLNRHQYVILITLKQRFSTFWYSRTPKLEIFIKNCVPPRAACFPQLRTTALKYIRI